MSAMFFGEGEVSRDKFTRDLVESPPPIISIDVETISLEERIPVGFSIATSPVESWYFKTFPEWDEEVELVRPLLNNPAIKKVFHNAPFDLRSLPLVYDIDSSNIADTNVMARLLGHIETKLTELSSELFGEAIESTPDLFARHQVKNFLGVPQEEIGAMCASHSRVTLRLFHEFFDKIDKDYFDVEMKVIPILISMSLRGLKVCQADRERIDQQLESELAYYKKICDDENFNPGSNQQVGFVLAKRKNFLPMTKSKKQLQVSAEQLEFLDDPLASVILSYRRIQKILSTYIRPLEGKDRIYTSYNLDAVVGRISSSNENIQNIPGAEPSRGYLPEGCRFIFEPDSGMFTTGDFCLSPDTLVLKRDLTWKRLDYLNIGDELIGIEEYPQGGKGIRRKMVRSTVRNLSLVNRDSFRITMTDNRVIITSGEHPWLIMDKIRHNSTAQHPVWELTKNLAPGTKIRQLCSSTWDTDKSYDAAYLAGFYDGEGWIDKSHHIVGFGQNEGNLLKDVIDKHHRLGFNPARARGSSSTTTQYRFTRLSEMLEFIGSVRPSRLLEKSDYLWEGYEPPKLDAWAEVESIEFIGRQELVSMETDTHTFVAEGLFTHNSQEHLRILAYLSQDREMIRVYEEGENEGDIHKKTMKELGLTRRLAKVINYCIPYGADAHTVSIQAKIRDLKRCQSFLDKWFETYPDAAYWIRMAKEEGIRDGVALPTLFGRRIRIPEEINAWGKVNKAAMERKAVNYPILGSDGEIMKRALIICESKGLPLSVCVHDSITCDGDVEFPIEQLEHISPVNIPFDVKKSIRWE